MSHPAPGVYTAWRASAAWSLVHLVFPGGQDTRLLEVFGLCLPGLLDFRHIEARGVLLNHAAHTEGRGAGADRLFHKGQPAVRQAVSSTLKVRRDDLIFQDAVER